jgi:protein-arginine kinase activator protein McsA
MANQKPPKTNKSSGTVACSNCGRTDASVTTYVNGATLERHYLCIVCEYERGRKGKKLSIAEIDAELKQYYELSGMYESLILSMPKETAEMAKSANEIGNMTKTPMSVFQDIKMMVAHLETLRISSAIAEGSEVYLNAELAKALATENFERAAAIRKELDALKK